MLSGWKETALWLLALYVLIFHADPIFDWMLAHPYLAVVAIGLAIFTAFAIDSVRDWRHGATLITSVREQIESGESGNSMGGAAAILGLMVIVWLVVVWASISMASDSQKSILVLILGGITAGIAAPFLLYPAVFLAGSMQPVQGFAAKVSLALETARDDVTETRAQLNGMPVPRGLTALVTDADDVWRADPVSLKARIGGLGTRYRVASRSPLVVEAETTAGDRETLTLKQVSPTELDATINIKVAGAWSRGCLLLAGQSGFARMAANIEAGRLTRMLGTKVSVVDEPKIV